MHLFNMKRNNKFCQGNGNFVTYAPCNKLTGLRGVYVGIDSLVGIINLLIAPVRNVLMRLGCWAREAEDFSRQ